VAKLDPGDGADRSVRAAPTSADGLRDYVAWHEAYDDPRSSLSWRLSVVQSWIERSLSEHSSPVRVLSVCAGDGRDILGVLARRPDLADVDVTLLEIDPVLTARARQRAADLYPRIRVDVRVADAGDPAAYSGAVSADIVMLVGIFGNITDADISRTIAAAPAMCRPGATVLWSRGRHGGDRTDEIRRRFVAAGFAEIGVDSLDREGDPTVGAMRFVDETQPMPTHRLFTFLR
jgi:methyltransferase family protein